MCVQILLRKKRKKTTVLDMCVSIFLGTKQKKNRNFYAPHKNKPINFPLPVGGHVAM
jgi:hypothetical protein